MQRVFGIGFHKTGTTSLGDALTVLGYRVTGPDFIFHPDLGQSLEQLALERAREFTGFQDNPWPLLYRQLDAWFPGSRFILTIRSPEAWYASAARHFGSETTPMRQLIYGTGCGAPADNRDIWLTRYNAHNRAVLEYFRDRPEALLVMNFEKGAGWDELCGFLGKPCPQQPFPHANQASRRDRPWPRLVGQMRTTVGRLRQRLTEPDPEP